MTGRQWSIGQTAEHLGLDPDTLRYFERRRIVPSPSRDQRGRRVYDDHAIHLLETLLHLRRTGMPLAEVAEFTRLVGTDPDGVPERLDLLTEHRERILAQQEQLAGSLRVVEAKIADYSGRSDS